MSRPANALTATLDGLMENSALAMEEQRHDAATLILCTQAWRELHRPVVSLESLRALLGTVMLRTAHSLDMDIADEMQLRGPSGVLDGHLREVTTRAHKRHEPLSQAARTHTVTL
jgi:hypothetical protein